MKTIDINKNKPHKVSEVICVKCGKRWIAARPKETKLHQLECKACGKGFVIETGEEMAGGIDDSGSINRNTGNCIVSSFD